jgi:hypothetical protein
MTEAITSRSMRGAGMTMPAAGTVDRIVGIQVQGRMVRQPIDRIDTRSVMASIHPRNWQEAIPASR